MIAYANNISDWEEWQMEYRFGAFYIFPPDNVIGPIDALRKRYDPKSDRYCQAHISLSEPLAAPLKTEDIHELRTILASIPPITISYGPLRTFLPHPGVCYRIEPEDSIQQLRRGLHSASCFRSISKKRESIAPHMTIAEFISAERTEELLKELQNTVPQGTFECKAVELAVPDDHFRFVRSLSIPLAH